MILKSADVTAPARNGSVTLESAGPLATFKLTLLLNYAVTVHRSLAAYWQQPNITKI
jgi:hypothetical protein